MVMNSLNKFVHCHICPLKDICPFSASDASWRYQHRPSPRYENETQYVTLDRDWEALHLATLNCSLKKMIQD